MKSELRGLVRRVVLVLLGLVLGINLYLWNARSLTGNASPMPFGYGASVVLSGSMEPALSVGDLLILKEAEDYRAGDVVVYQSGSMPVVHRIVDIADGMVTTRGDANNVCDPPFSGKAIKGKVIAAIPLAGYAVQALKSPIGIALTLGAAVLLVEGSCRGQKKEDEETEKIKAEIRRLMAELEAPEE